MEDAAIVRVNRSLSRGWLDAIDTNAVQEPRTALDRLTHDHLVQRVARDHQCAGFGGNRGGGGSPVRRHHLVGVDPPAALCDRPQQPHLSQHAQRPRGEAVAAGLVTRKIGSIQQQDVKSVGAQEVRRRRSAGTGTHHDHIMDVNPVERSGTWLNLMHHATD